MTTTTAKLLNFWNNKATAEQREAVIREFASSQSGLGAMSVAQFEEAGAEADSSFVMSLREMRANSKGELVVVIECGYRVGFGSPADTLLFFGYGLLNRYPRTEAGLARTARGAHTALMDYYLGTRPEDREVKALVRALAVPAKLTQKAVAEVVRVKFVAAEQDQLITAEHIKELAQMGKALEADDLGRNGFNDSDLARQLLAYPYLDADTRARAEAYLADPEAY